MSEAITLAVYSPPSKWERRSRPNGSVEADDDHEIDLIVEQAEKAGIPAALLTA